MDRSRSHENPKCCHHSLDSRRDCRVAARAGLFPRRIHSKWEEGIVITVLAICLLVRPPRFSLGVPTNLVLLALLILAAVAFFPASWFFQPEWRAALVNDFGIQLHRRSLPSRGSRWAIWLASLPG
jgi:hypothetical protein